MAVKIGHKNAELVAQADRIRTQADGLLAGLPRQPLQALELVCTCDRCIDPPAYEQLIHTPPPQLTTYMVGQYFGGAGAVPVETGPAEKREAHVILIHVLSHLGEAVCRTRDEERTYHRQTYFIEPAYWIEGLFRTGVMETLPHDVLAQIRVFLTDVVTHAAANGSARLCDALTYLALATPALPDVLEHYRRGPPRRHLRFWTAVAGGSVGYGPDGQNPRGIDLFASFSTMPTPSVEALASALAHPDTERMLERYAFAAKDRDWLTYLSRLIQWREATLLQSQYSDQSDR